MKKIILFAAFCFLSTNFMVAQEDNGWHYISKYKFESEGNTRGAIYPVNENLLFVVTDGGRFYKSLDGGDSWEEYDTNVQEIFYDLLFTDENKGFAVGTNGTLMKTINSGESWSKVTLDTNSDLYAVATTPSNDIFIVGKDGIIVKSLDEGNNWYINHLSSEIIFSSIKFKDELTGFVCGKDGTLYKTIDKGLTWQVVNVGTTEDLFSLNIVDDIVYMLAGSSGEVYNGNYYPSYSATTLIKSIDVGETWESRELQSSMGLEIAAMFFSEDGKGYFASSGLALCECCFNSLDITINEGESWGEYFSIKNEDFAYCWFDPEYADMYFFNNELGYILFGEHIMTNADLGYYSVKEFEKLNFSFYPNPVNKGHFNLNLNSTIGQQLIFEIFDLNGKSIKHFSVENNQKQIDVSNLSKGIYFLTAHNLEKNTFETKKLVIN